MLPRRWSVVVLSLFVIAATPLPAQNASVRADADTMQRKLEVIVTRAELPPSPSRPAQRTSFTDREANAYFRVKGPEFLPEGVLNPQVAIGEGGRLRARATVDLDLALKPRQRGWLDPLAYVGGKVDIESIGTLHAANGRGVLRLEKTTLNGVEIPKSVLQELVTFFSRSDENPRGFQIEEPFELPSAIRAVQTAPGRAIVVQ